MYAEPLIVLITFLASLGGLYSHKAFQHRFRKSSVILNRFVDPSGKGIPPQYTHRVDCIAVIPEFQKAATTHESASGYGFLSCRNDDHWSAPAAVMLEDSKPAMVADGRRGQIIMVSMNRNFRSKLLSGQSAPEPGDSALEKSAESQSETNADVILFGDTKTGVAELALNGARLKADDAGNKALYGKPLPSSTIIDGGAATPKVARDFITSLTAILN